VAQEQVLEHEVLWPGGRTDVGRTNPERMVLAFLGVEPWACSIQAVGRTARIEGRPPARQPTVKARIMPRRECDTPLAGSGMLQMATYSPGCRSTVR
jgi:hypothetical protein